MGAIRDFLDSVGRTKTGYVGTPIPGAPPVAPTAATAGTKAEGSNQTDAEKYATDKAAFDETLRKYQLDRRAYEQYQGDVNARLRNFNPYADAQYRIMPTNTGAPVPMPTAPAAPTKLNAPTYGAIPITMSTPTDQGASYKQMRDFGYTDADIRSATSKVTGSPTDQKWGDILSAGYSQYAPAVQGAYQQLGRSGFGGGAEQIDTPGYSYWLNQLSSGAVRPEDLNQAVLTAGRPSNYGEIQNIYQQYFNRTPDPSGAQYWGQSGLTGSALQNAIIAGAQGPDLAYYQQNFGGGTQQPINQPTGPEPDPYYGGGPGPGGGAARGGYISKYAEGGRVRTHYQTGGRADEGNLEELDAFYRDPRNFTRPTPLGPARTYQEQMREAMPSVPPVRGLPSIGETLLAIGEGGTLQPMGGEPAMPMVAGAPTVDPTPAEPVEGTQVAVPSRPAGSQNPMEAILARYLSGTGDASRELTSARQRSQSESEAFYNLIRQMSERGESPTSRAEMYFRLASAFGAPTRTGQMGETLSRVGEQMGEYTRGRQADERERRGLLLKAQETRMGAAREDLATTRALAAQEGTERAGIVRELVKEYVRSGEPQTEAEKEARALGLVGQEKADFIRRRIMSSVQNAERRLTQLEPGELKTYNDNRELVDRTKIAIDDLRRAIALNPRSLPGGLGGRLAYGAGSLMGSEAEIMQNTEQLKNILGRITVDSLKATFPGAISNSEREALERLSGATSSSVPARERIMRDALRRLETMVENAERRMNDVQTRANRNTRPEGSQGQSGGR